MEKNKKDQQKLESESEIMRLARGEDVDDQNDELDEETPMGWARQVAEEEAAGLD